MDGNPRARRDGNFSKHHFPHRGFSMEFWFPIKSSNSNDMDGQWSTSNERRKKQQQQKKEERVGSLDAKLVDDSRIVKSDKLLRKEYRKHCNKVSFISVAVCCWTELFSVCAYGSSQPLWFLQNPSGSSRTLRFGWLTLCGVRTVRIPSSTTDILPSGFTYFSARSELRRRGYVHPDCEYTLRV